LITAVATLEKPRSGVKRLPKPLISSSKIVRVDDQELVCAALDAKSENVLTTFKRGR
jgi:hypothetical protein